MAEKSQSSAKRRRGPGKPFQKGQSGNPGGRPAIPAEVKEALAAACPHAVERLIQFVDNPDPKIALAACERVVERVLGRVPLPLQGADGAPLAVSISINRTVKESADA